MKENRFKYVVYAVLLVFVIAGTILSNILASSEYSQDTSIIVLVFTIILDILSMAYFIAQDIISNMRTISRFGSLSLFETTDRESVSSKVIDKLCVNPDEHVIYVECNGLPRVELENIKQRIYEDLTERNKNNDDKKKCKNFPIGNVFIPATFDIQEFNESVFYNRTMLNKHNIYIFDNYSANSFYINQIGKRLNKRHNNKKNNIAKNTYIIYLTNRRLQNKTDLKNNNALTASIQREDIVKLIKQITNIGTDKLDSLKFPACSVDKCEIRNIFVIEKLLNDTVNQRLIGKNPNLIFVLYYNETGNYKIALELLCSYIQNADTEGCGDLNKCDLYIRYLFADTLHLLNIYQVGIVFCASIISAIRDNQKDLYNNLKAETYKKYAHILKHLGKFTSDEISFSGSGSDDSNNILNEISAMNQLDKISHRSKYELKTEISGIEGEFEDNTDYVNKKTSINIYFSFLMAALCSDPSTIHSTTRVYDREKFIKHISYATQLFSCSDSPDDMMYYAAFLAYKNPSQAMQHIDEVIEYYEKVNQRRKYNAYYIKAEILRVLGDYGSAYEFYIKSSGITEGHADVNLLDQNYFSLKALEKLNFVNGMASFQVKSYKDSLFASDGMRKDYDTCISRLSEIFKTAEFERCERPTLVFNKTLLSYIDAVELKSDDLKKLLAENIFIIL